MTTHRAIAELWSLVPKTLNSRNILYPVFSIIKKVLVIIPRKRETRRENFPESRTVSQIGGVKLGFLRKGGGRMSDHLVLYVDRLMRSEDNENDEVIVNPHYSEIDVDEESIEDVSDDQEGESLIGTAECRICQEEDRFHKLETPCGCSGSLKYAHRKCVQRWCNEKGDITCEICHQQYQPGYTAPPPPSLEDAAIDIRGWTINGVPLNLRDPHLMAMAEAESHYVETDYEEYTASNAGGAAFCRSAALILMALLLMRHALTMSDSDGNDEDDASTFFSLFLLRAAGFLLPCYIMAWAISILQQRRQRQEAAAMAAATQVAFVLRSGQHRGLHFAIAPRPSSPREEPV